MVKNEIKKVTEMLDILDNKIKDLRKYIDRLDRDVDKTREELAEHKHKFISGKAYVSNDIDPYC